MAIRALMFAGLCAGLLALVGCGTTPAERLAAATARQALAERDDPLPTLPDSCTALMGRVDPSPQEAWVLTQKRWEILADNRDAQARACPKDWAAYWVLRNKRGNGQ